MASKLIQRRTRRLKSNVAWWMAEAQDWKDIALKHALEIERLRALVNGLTLRDWRYVVRIANIDVSDLSVPASAANIVTQMVKALHRVPNLKMGRAVFYMNRTVGQALDLQSLDKASLALSVKETEGNWWTTFRGIPIRETDAILETEARVV